jgi:ADP-heptose:LPS heptosyltransferase
MTKMNIEQPINILVQRRGAIGDTVMSTGVVRELKQRYGANAYIDVATDCAEAYRNNPHIRNIFPVDQVPSVNNRYEQYINLDLAYEMNPRNHLVDSMFYRAFGDNDLDHAVELFPDAEDQTRVLNLQYANQLDQYIVVHMRNWHWQAKNITLDVWFELFVKLFETRTDFKIVCVGGDSDGFLADHPNFVDARAHLNLQQQKVLCDGAAAFVGIDSSPYWAAAASSTHIVSLSTLFRNEQVMPYRNRVRGNNCTPIVTQEDCAGCWETQPTPVRQPLCHKGNTPCNNNFDTTAIASAILGTLK